MKFVKGTLEYKEFKTWIEALRSGKFKQGTGLLQSKKGFCCLGVACKILILEAHQDIKYKRLQGGLPKNQIFAPSWLKYINDDFKEKIYIKELHQPTIGLDILNDALRLTFDEIADCLEAVYIHDAMK